MILSVVVAAILIEQFSLPRWYYALLGAGFALDYAARAFRDRRILAAIQELQQKLSKTEGEIERANLTLQVLNEESIETSAAVRSVEGRIRAGEL
ncbi:hypothetical protein [Pararhodobacter aggregans]|uniref:Uncharacterized protein n=1 Tax=Pararhodobacter aggregans TaxID=404875 RepID=A0A2T7UR41_9RHOB|nr:hypothetical protein [Pararhodobacter aggregans]PTX02044.1 hypothetical protein C8N33_106263 [Pararhodobacter aggregans]PVE47220.1 hypothetical protein DDE23_13335 [Pararhodobacter aggregans]